MYFSAIAFHFNIQDLLGGLPELERYNHTNLQALMVNATRNTAGIYVMTEKKSFWQMKASVVGLVEVIAILTFAGTWIGGFGRCPSTR